MNPTSESPKRRWLALAIVVAAQFMYVVDAFVLNVAIPSIKAELGATGGEIDAVIVLYLIAFATLVITGGRLGDIFGSKQIFLAGLLSFTATSIWCGLSQSPLELIAARCFQGASAALMIPQVLATIHRLFQDHERGKAFGIYGIALGLGGAVGVGIGGWLVTLNLAGLGWRMIFFVNGPIGLALWLAALRLMPRAPRNRKMRLDAAGAGLLFAALLCLNTPILFGRELGWPAWILEMLGATPLLLRLFWWVETRIERRGGLPLISLDLMRSWPFAMGLLAVGCFTFANLSFYLVITLYLQMGRHLPPQWAGSAILPVALAFAVASRMAGSRAQRKGPAALIEGCAVQIAGMTVVGAWVAIDPAIDPALFAALLVVFGLGQGMVMAPLYGHVLRKVPSEYAGAGAGVVNTVSQIGNGTGIAVVGAVYFTAQAAVSDSAAFVAACAVLLGMLVATAAAIAVAERNQQRVVATA